LPQIGSVPGGFFVSFIQQRQDEWHRFHDDFPLGKLRTWKNAARIARCGAQVNA
jgi:hypothetical protein